MINDFFLFFLDNKSGWKTNEKKLSNKEPKIYKEVKDFVEKHSLNHLTFKQQVWHFIHKYIDIPKCSECGQNLKFKRSLNEGYGKYCSISCTNKNKDHIESSKKSWSLKKEETLNKIKKTNLEKYGVENTFQKKELVVNGFKKKYGVSHPSEIEGVNEKRKKTFLSKYGYTSNFTNKLNRDKVIQNRYDNFLLKYPNIKFKKLTGHNLLIECDLCNSTYEIYRTLFRHRYIYNKTICTNCNPINSSDSFFEKEIVDFIKSFYTKKVIENDRLIISPKEIDILLPEDDLAIEFNGLYWHSSEFNDDNYHINKTNLCEEKNINLIHVFEDEWVYKKEIVKSIIKTKLNIYEKKIYARKCEVKNINSKEYKDFCNQNHIQGHVNSLIKLGLYYNNELVSIMSFGNLRKSLGSKKENETYEMLRFCNKLNVLVIGGASKLFSFFIKNNNPSKIISYSDIRYFNGNLYEKLNFKIDKQTKPNYFYITDYLKRENRFKFRKDVLVKEGFDKNKTEKQIMSDRGIYRIYDCGNKKWIWEK